MSTDELLKENEVFKKKIEGNSQKSALIRGNVEKDEGLLLLIIAFIGCLIPPIGLILAPIIIKKNKKTNTVYKFVYLACVCCILVNVYALYFTVGNYLGWGTTTVELVD